MCISKGFSHVHQNQNLNGLWTRGAELINVLAGIRVYWWEKSSKINKRTGTFIWDPRVQRPNEKLKNENHK